MGAEADAGSLGDWLDAAIRVTGEIALSFGLGELQFLACEQPRAGLHGAFVGLFGEERSLDIGVASTPEGCRCLAAAFSGGLSPSELAESDVDDALGEMANMLAGGIKREMAATSPNLVTGLPTFVRGTFRKGGNSESSTAHLRIGQVDAWLVMHRFPSAPEVRAERRAQRDLREAHAELRSVSELLQEVFRAMPEGLVVTDSRAVIEAANQAALTMLEGGEADLVGKPLAALFEGAEAQAAASVEALAALSAPLRKECTCISSKGTHIPVLLSASPMKGSDGALRRAVCVLLDIRERRRLEIDLRQAQKLEAIGRLAAGVAHEINTPIQFVSDNVHFLHDAIADLQRLIKEYQAVLHRTQSEEDAAALTGVEQEVDLDFLLGAMPKATESSLEGLSRVATIVQAMKEFAHPEQTDSVPLDLSQAIRAVLTIANNEYKYVADAVVELADLPPVVCNAGLLNQAILNILVNAAHAIEDVVKDTGQKGRITVRTRREGDSALISISDTGCGIPVEIRDRIFDPFFTTKEVGRGTGQGLAIARSVIVEKHGGDIRFTTEVGKGTTFFIQVPIDGKRLKATQEEGSS